MAKKITNEIIRERLHNRVGNEYTLISDYTTGSTKVDLLHLTCGKVYSVTPNHFFHDNTRCKCQWNIKQPSAFADEFKEVANNEYASLHNIKLLRIPYTYSDADVDKTISSYL